MHVQSPSLRCDGGGCAKSVGHPLDFITVIAYFACLVEQVQSEIPVSTPVVVHVLLHRLAVVRPVKEASCRCVINLMPYVEWAVDFKARLRVRVMKAVRNWRQKDGFLKGALHV